MKPVVITLKEGRPTVNQDIAHLNGAALVDAQGVEIPITEEMIQQALKTMDDNWVSFYTQH